MNEQITIADLRYHRDFDVSATIVEVLNRCRLSPNSDVDFHSFIVAAEAGGDPKKPTSEQLVQDIFGRGRSIEALRERMSTELPDLPHDRLRVSPGLAQAFEIASTLRRSSAAHKQYLGLLHILVVAFTTREGPLAEEVKELLERTGVDRVEVAKQATAKLIEHKKGMENLEPWREYLTAHDYLSDLFGRKSPDASQLSEWRHETQFASDRAETTRDLLGRAPLAFALAAQINRIWDTQTRGEPESTKWQRRLDAVHLTQHPRPAQQADEAAFIMHIDAPWGGGKTTFANFVARILNPAAFGLHEGSTEAALLANLPMTDDKLWPLVYRERRWHVVSFNAWQHEHVAPPWWNFYETIRRRCLRALPLGPRLWFSVREWLWKVLTPALLRNLVVFVVLFGIVLLIWNTGWFQTLTVAEGDGADKGGEQTGAALLGAITLLLTGGAGIAFVNMLRSGLTIIVEGVSGSADSARLGESDPLFRFQQHFSWLVRQLREPVLVIVDDLDRCRPAYVIELVRGMLTMFRSPRVVFLLLGDKVWIETAFAQVHADMAAAHSDRQISFGGRFAEKAIQLSFILPAPTERSRSEYLGSVLAAGLEPAGDPATAAQLEQLRRKTREEMSTAQGGVELTKATVERLRKVEQDFPIAAGVEGAGRTRAARAAAEQIVQSEAVFRSATSPITEIETQHGLEPLKPFLPGNPRRIKRIVNMMSVFQESARLSSGIGVLSREWRQLALWTVIMSEYPQVWRMLVSDEAMATKLLAIAAQAQPDGRVSLAGVENIAPEAQKTQAALLTRIAGDPRLIRLIRGEPFDASHPNEKHAIDETTLEFLRLLTPVD